jgi:hypothetical protein
MRLSDVDPLLVLEVDLVLPVAIATALLAAGAVAAHRAYRLLSD